MDQLELLKRDWKNQEKGYPRLSGDELSKLIHKRSSSIVKWLFIVSLLEFLIPNLLFLFTGYNKNLWDTYKELGLEKHSLVFNAVFYLVILYFIYRFYKNYTSIASYSNTKTLINNMLRTRKTVKNYIRFNLIMAAIAAAFVSYKTIHSAELANKIPDSGSLFLVWGITIVSIVVVLGLVYLFYRLLYGILVKKLMKNYQELIDNHCP